MKQTLTYVLIATLAISCSSCKKNVPVDNNGLPAATQEGKNTLGFMRNGVLWIPKGIHGVASNLSVNVDFGFSNGGFTLSAYNVISNSLTEYVNFGIADSLNFMTIPIIIDLKRKSQFGISFTTNTCSIFSKDTTVYQEGSLSINKLDKTNRIIAGTFNAILYQQGCDTIKITDGRFDMKF